jgi:hypothetical protein
VSVTEDLSGSTPSYDYAAIGILSLEFDARVDLLDFRHYAQNCFVIYTIALIFDNRVVCSAFSGLTRAALATLSLNPAMSRNRRARGQIRVGFVALLNMGKRFLHVRCLPCIVQSLYAVLRSNNALRIKPKCCRIRWLMKGLDYSGDREA